MVTVTPLTVTSILPWPGLVFERMLHVQPQMPSLPAVRGPSPCVLLTVPEGVV